MKKFLVILFLCGCSTSEEIPKVVTDQKPEEIEVLKGETSYSFGEVLNTQEGLSHVYSLVNKSSEDVVIERVRNLKTCCGIVRLHHPSKFTVEPGKQYDLEVEVKVRDQNQLGEDQCRIQGIPSIVPQGSET